MGQRTNTAIEEAINFESEMLPPRIVAPILGMGQQTYRILAREEPENFSFPIITAGAYVRTPKRPFLKSLGIE